MLFEVGDETLAQVEQLGAGFLGDLAADVGILVEPLVIGIGAVGFFTNDSGCAKDDPGANAVDVFDHVPEATFKSFGRGAFFTPGDHPRVGPVPDVVNANIDKDDGGLFLQHVLIEASLAVRHFVATDTRTNELDVEVRVGLGNGLGTEGDVATRAWARGGDRVSEEDDAVIFLQRGLLGVETSREGEDGQCGDEYEFHACCSGLLLGEDGFDEIGCIDRIFEIVDEFS